MVPAAACLFPTSYNFTPELWLFILHRDHSAPLCCVLQEYKCHNADILLKEDSTVDDLIDVIEVVMHERLLS